MMIMMMTTLNMKEEIRRDVQPEVVTEVSATHELKEEAHWLSHGTHLRAVFIFDVGKKNNSLKCRQKERGTILEG